MNANYSANELDKKVMNLLGSYDVGELDKYFTLIGSGQINEIYNRSGNAHLYYQWLSCLIKLLKPIQVVELGAAAGISTIMMAAYMPKGSKLYSVDIDPTAWKWMNYEFPSVVKILGDDLDLAIYPKECDLSKTDIWFIDSLHEEAQLRKEIELYKPYWKKGTVVVLDDIRINEGMNKVWNELPYDKYENTNPCHFSGFGLFIT